MLADDVTGLGGDDVMLTSAERWKRCQKPLFFVDDSLSCEYSECLACQLELIL